MGFLKNFLSRILPASSRINPRPDHEDVDMGWMKLDGSSESSMSDNVDPSAALAAGGVRNKASHGRLEPDLHSARPAAAIPIPESELRAIESGDWEAHVDERGELLQELHELGYNLKRVVGDVAQIQQLVTSDFESLSEIDKEEARAFIKGLSALVVRNEPARQAA